MIYAATVVIKAHLVIILILFIALSYEIISGRLSIFNYRAYNIPSNKSQEFKSVVNVVLFCYLCILFIYFIIDAYIFKNVTDDFYFIYWLIIVYPLFFCFRKLIRFYFSLSK